MTQEVLLLAGAALSVGIVHTALGPDHYVPFIAMARARNWSVAKTIGITTLCGLAHVLSSIVIVALVQKIGSSFGDIAIIEKLRSTVVGWGLMTVGLAYCTWGIRQAFAKNARPELAAFTTVDTTAPKRSPVAFFLAWVVILVVVLGPCEPVIPFLMMPVAAQNGVVLAIVLSAFIVATIGTMLTAVLTGVFGVRHLPFTSAVFFRRYAHSLAGAAIALCGMCVQFLGL